MLPFFLFYSSKGLASGNVHALDFFKNYGPNKVDPKPSYASDTTKICFNSLAKEARKQLNQQLYDGGRWTVDNPDGYVQGDTLFIAKSPGLFNLTYSYMNQGGFQQREQLIKVLESPEPEIVISTDVDICSSDTVHIEALFNETIGIPRLQWRILAADAKIEDRRAENTRVFFPENASVTPKYYTLYLTVSTEGNCTETVEQNINLLPDPKPNFQFDGTACGSYSGHVTNLTNAAESYEWIVRGPDGYEQTYEGFEPYINFPENLSDSTLDYTITLIARNRVGCESRHTETFSIDPIPEVAFSALDTAGCSNSIFHFENLSPDLKGKKRELNFEWLLIDGSDTTVLGYERDLTTPLSNDTDTARQYKILLTGTTWGGCQDTASALVTVYPLPIAAFSASDQSGCAPFEVTPGMIQLTEYPGRNASYDWYIIEDGEETFLHSGEFPGYTVAEGQTVSLKLVVSSPYGCQDDVQEMPFSSLSSPEADFSFTISPEDSCETVRLTVTNQSEHATNLYWDFGNGETYSGAFPPDVIYEAIDNQETVYQVQLVAANECSTDTITKEVLVKPRPDASFSLAFDPNNCLSISPVPVEINASFSYNWVLEGPDGCYQSSTDTVPVFNLPANTSNQVQIYQLSLWVQSPEGCTGTYQQEIAIDPQGSVNITLDPLQACKGSAFTFTNIFSAEEANQYNWYLANEQDTRLVSTDQDLEIVLTNDSDSTISYWVILESVNVQGCIAGRRNKAFRATIFLV